MLKGFNNVGYTYDSNGQRFKKTEAVKTTLYTYDGKKLLSEDIIGKTGQSKRIEKGKVYIYDNEGIAGYFETDYVKANKPLTVVYYYIKDALGNVVSIVNGYGTECARYEYDAWGCCTVYTKDNAVDTEANSIGNTNAIRWKSQYYDVESGLYYIDGRYYSPEKREYLDPLSAEEVFAQATTPGVDVFALTVTNPLEVGFVSYTADSFQEMSYDPEEMTNWEYFWKVKWNRFWDSSVGKALSISLFVVALVLAILSSFVPCVGVARGECSLQYSA